METKNNLSIKEFLIWVSNFNLEQVYTALQTSHQGLPVEEIADRVGKYGKNTVVRETSINWYWMILNNFKNPFVLVLILLGIISYLTQDKQAAIIVSIMVAISVLMRFIQEFRSSKAAESLRDMVRTYATVTRIITDGTVQKNKNLMG